MEEDNNRNANAQERSEQLNDQVENRNGDRDNIDARKGTSINITTIVLVVILLALVFGLIFIGVQVVNANKNVVKVEQESIDRDNDIRDDITNLENRISDSIKNIRADQERIERELKGKINSLQVEVKNNKAEINQLKITPPAPPVAEETKTKKTSNKSKKKKKFSFEDIEAIGEQFEEIF
ncbi:MAG: hypothetical protein ACOXZ1_01000 [Patescibacteria group bacterium]|jgi:uncharacterized protein HemX